MQSMIVILNNLRGSQNVGSIFRTAEAAGCSKIYLCGITPAPIDRFGRPNSKLLKVSLGAEKYLTWEQVKSTTKLIDELKKQGYQILALEQAPNAISLFDFKAEVRRKPDIGLTSESLLCKSTITPFRVSVPTLSNLHATSIKNFALVLGNEIKGLPRSILNRADKILEIPMAGRKESLNVAVAFGIAVFRLQH